jgi:hypothetical protein
VTLTATDVDNGEIVTKEILIKGLIGLGEFNYSPFKFIKMGV